MVAVTAYRLHNYAFVPPTEETSNESTLMTSPSVHIPLSIDIPRKIGLHKYLSRDMRLTLYVAFQKAVEVGRVHIWTKIQGTVDTR